MFGGKRGTKIWRRSCILGDSEIGYHRKRMKWEGSSLSKSIFGNRCWTLAFNISFFKNRCRNAVSKMVLRKTSLKIYKYLQKCHRVFMTSILVEPLLNQHSWNFFLYPKKPRSRSCGGKEVQFNRLRSVIVFLYAMRWRCMMFGAVVGILWSPRVN